MDYGEYDARLLLFVEGDGYEYQGDFQQVGIPQLLVF
jgi:hypothetical protein